MQTLADLIAARIPDRIDALKQLIVLDSQTPIHTLTVENIIGGLRGTPALLWETSETTEYGIRIHGKPLEELVSALPKWKGSAQASPEAMLWFLYTAQHPTQVQLEHFVADLASRATLPEEVSAFVDSLPNHLSPYSKVIMGVTALSPHSKLTKALNGGTRKSDLWRFALEDTLDLTARTIYLIARIFITLHRPDMGAGNNSFDPTKDLAENLSTAFGREHDINFIELIRLYWVLHIEHGVNVSAHVARLCGSAWTDAYLTATASLSAGTGLLHAGAIQRSISFNSEMQDVLGLNPTDENIATYISTAISKGTIIPGYGHAVLRHLDPRLQVILDFIAKIESPTASGSNGELTDTATESRPSDLQFIARVAKIAPAVLRQKIPRMKNTFPNVDAFSGSVLHSYGVEIEFLLPLITSCRVAGVAVQYVWDRALGAPIERPLSLTLNELTHKCAAYHSQLSILGSLQSSVKQWYKLAYLFVFRSISPHKAM